MRTTLEIPDPVLRRARSKAAKRGITLSQFVAEAVNARLKRDEVALRKPWMKMVGGLRPFILIQCRPN